MQALQEESHDAPEESPGALSATPLSNSYSEVEASQPHPQRERDTYLYPGAGQFVDDYDDKDDAFEESVTNGSARNVPETPEKLSARDKDPQYLTQPQIDHYAPDPMLQSEERFQ